MIYGSVCSGIEAATAAWKPLGWKAAFFSEIDKFPSAVLAHHYPGVPNLGDMAKFKEWPDAALDVLVGGTPCQSFSVAGLRKGLDDPRGNLMLTYLAIADRYRPRWIVWENVPGVLSSGEGRDFGTFLGALGQLGYGWAYRVLDAQYVRTCRFPGAVPQRRRRVFVVGHLGDRRRAAAVLFDRESLRGNPPPRREAGQIAAPSLAARTRGGGGLGTDTELDGGLIPQVANPLTARMHKGVNTDLAEGQTMVAHALRGEGFDASEDGTGRGTPIVPVLRCKDCGEQFQDPYGLEIGGLAPFECPRCGEEERLEVVSFRVAGDGAAYEEGAVTAPLTTGTDTSAQVVVFDTTQITSPGNYSQPKPGDACHPLAAGAHPPAVEFSCKDYGADAGETAPTLRAMGHADSHANAGGQVAVAFAQNQRGELRLSDVSPQLTTGGGKPGEGYPAVAFDMRGREGGAMPEGPHDTANLRAASGGSSRSYVAQQMENKNADASEADASSVLSTLRKSVGEEAFQQWGLGILAALRAPEILRAWLHGGSLRGPAEEIRPKLDDGALPRAKSGPGARLLRTLWEEGPDGRSPQGRGLAKQLAGEPGAALSVLPHQGTSPTDDLHRDLLRSACEGARLLRQALSALEEVGRPTGGQDQPEHAPWAVRRLTPREAERLQGFPDDFTAIPWRGKPADQCPDGPRYKALGNSMAVPVMEWIGQRIELVEALG